MQPEFADEVSTVLRVQSHEWTEHPKRQTSEALQEELQQVILTAEIRHLLAAGMPQHLWRHHVGRAAQPRFVMRPVSAKPHGMCEAEKVACLPWRQATVVLQAIIARRAELQAGLAGA